jgi:hypothetical protein
MMLNLSQGTRTLLHRTEAAFLPQEGQQEKECIEANILLMDVIYYQYLLFYKNILKVPEPFFNTILAIGACQSFLINALLDITSLKISCYQIPVWFQFAVTILIVYLNYLTYIKKKRAKKIVREKPLFGKSKTLSIVISILFFLLSISWLFWGGIYAKHLLSLCK